MMRYWCLFLFLPFITTLALHGGGLCSKEEKTQDKSSKPPPSPQQLFQALLNNQTLEVERLLLAGAAVTQTDNNGNTSLHIAVTHQNFSVINLLGLTAARTQVNTPNNQGITPLELAKKQGYKVIVFMISQWNERKD